MYIVISASILKMFESQFKIRHDHFHPVINFMEYISFSEANIFLDRKEIPPFHKIEKFITLHVIFFSHL